MPRRREPNPVWMGSKNKIAKSVIRDHKEYNKKFAKDMQGSTREMIPPPMKFEVSE